MKSGGIRSMVLLCLLFVAFPGRAKAGEPESTAWMDPYDKAFIQLVEPALDAKATEEDAARELTKYLQDPKISGEQRYLATRQLANELYFFSRIEELEKNCQDFPPKDDDFAAQALCLIADTRIPFQTRTQQLSEVFEKSLVRRVGTVVPLKVATKAAGFMTDNNDMARSSSILQRALAVAPKEAHREILSIKASIGNLYTLPLNKTSTVEVGLKILDEVESGYRPISVENAEVIAYNKGVIQLFVFDDFRKALSEFARVRPNSYNNIDVKVFSSYALAKLGERESALEALSGLDLAAYPDPQRRAFLECYASLAKYLVGLNQDISICTHLPADTQTDVVQHITRELAEMKLPRELELGLWRQFWRFYRSRILYELRQTIGQSIDLVEFQRVKMESATKELELSNMRIYRQLTWTLIGLAISLLASVGIVWSSLRRVRKQNEIISRQHREYRAILDSMQEGLLQLDANLQILPDRSAYTDRLFPEPLKNFEQLMRSSRLSADQLSITIESLKAIIGEDEVAWDMNETHLPLEVAFGPKTYSFHWQPVFVRKSCERMTLTIRDITEEREAIRRGQLAVARSSRQTQMLQVLLSSDHASRSLDFIRSLSKVQQGIPVDHMLRKIHTLKGTARTLHLTPLQDAAHQLESAYQNGSDDLRREGFKAWSELVQEWTELAELFQGNSDDRCIADLFWEIIQPLQENLREKGWKIGTAHIHDSFGWLDQMADDCYAILLHGLTNACDHGFILPAQKGWSSPEPIEFAVETETRPGARILRILDNGAGIPWEKVAILAKERGFQADAGRPLSDVLFLDQVSTATSVSLTSGRGVGLSAVAQIMKDRGGHVQLLDRNDGRRGSMLECQWPA